MNIVVNIGRHDFECAEAHCATEINMARTYMYNVKNKKKIKQSKIQVLN